MMAVAVEEVTALCDPSWFPNWIAPDDERSHHRTWTLEIATTLLAFARLLSGWWELPVCQKSRNHVEVPLDPWSKGGDCLGIWSSGYINDVAAVSDAILEQEHVSAYQPVLQMVLIAITQHYGSPFARNGQAGNSFHPLESFVSQGKAPMAVQECSSARAKQVCDMTMKKRSSRAGEDGLELDSLVEQLGVGTELVHMKCRKACRSVLHRDLKPTNITLLGAFLMPGLNKHTIEVFFGRTDRKRGYGATDNEDTYVRLKKNEDTYELNWTGSEEFGLLYDPFLLVSDSFCNEYWCPFYKAERGYAAPILLREPEQRCAPDVLYFGIILLEILEYGEKRAKRSSNTSHCGSPFIRPIEGLGGIHYVLNFMQREAELVAVGRNLKRYSVLRQNLMVTGLWKKSMRDFLAAAGRFSEQRILKDQGQGQQSSNDPGNNGILAITSSNGTLPEEKGFHQVGISEHHSGSSGAYIVDDGGISISPGITAWLVASAAPHHATGNRALLSDYTPEQGDLFVQAADAASAPMRVLGRGNVKTEAVVLSDVWFVPGLRANLVSVRQLVELDLIVGFGREKCYVRSSADGAVLGEACAGEDGLFAVQFLKVPLPM